MVEPAPSYELVVALGLAEREGLTEWAVEVGVSVNELAARLLTRYLRPPGAPRDQVDDRIGETLLSRAAGGGHIPADAGARLRDAAGPRPVGIRQPSCRRRRLAARGGLMGWGTDEHEGWADEKWPDGSWSGPTHRGGDPDAVAYQAVCSCGWRSEREHPVLPRPHNVPRDERGFAHGPAWDAWIETLEAASDACWNDWQAEHFDPLLGFEPHTQLIEAADGGGRRHFLDGRPVHAGTALELLLRDGHWVAGRYEWSYEDDARPRLHVALGGPSEAQRQHATVVVEFELPSRAVLRWPSKEGA